MTLSPILLELRTKQRVLSGVQQSSAAPSTHLLWSLCTRSADQRSNEPCIAIYQIKATFMGHPTTDGCANVTLHWKEDWNSAPDDSLNPGFDVKERGKKKYKKKDAFRLSFLDDMCRILNSKAPDFRSVSSWLQSQAGRLLPHGRRPFVLLFLGFDEWEYIVC